MLALLESERLVVIAVTARDSARTDNRVEAIDTLHYFIVFVACRLVLEIGCSIIFTVSL
jgi:hypothetical protein